MSKNLNKPKAQQKLKKLTWEELDWLEQRCRELKVGADGPRVYSSGGDSTHRAQGATALREHFEDTFEKHHGGSMYDYHDDDNY
jgi:hypothetical protein